MQPDMPSGQNIRRKQIPFTANPPVGSGILPRSGEVIRSNVPLRLSNFPIPEIDSQKEFELSQYIAAHKRLVSQVGHLSRLPIDRDIKIGNTVIPKEIVRHIGEWAVPVVAGPEVFLKPGEKW